MEEKMKGNKKKINFIIKNDSETNKDLIIKKNLLPILICGILLSIGMIILLTYTLIEFFRTYDIEYYHLYRLHVAIISLINYCCITIIGIGLINLNFFHPLLISNKKIRLKTLLLIQLLSGIIFEIIAYLEYIDIFGRYNFNLKDFPMANSDIGRAPNLFFEVFFLSGILLLISASILFFRVRRTKEQ